MGTPHYRRPHDEGRSWIVSSRGDSLWPTSKGQLHNARFTHAQDNDCAHVRVTAVSGGGEEDQVSR